MAVRLKVGTYIIDAAETGSTSTTTGCRLLTKDMPGAQWAEGYGDAEIPFGIQVARDTTANLKTSLDALVAALTATVNADLVLEYASGSTLNQWLVSTGAWSRITCRVEVHEGKTGAVVLAVFRAERLAPTSGAAGDSDGQLGPMDWSEAFDANGRGSLSLSATFQTLAKAKTWVGTIRSGASLPAFIGSAWRFLTVGYSHQRQENQASPPPAASYTPCTATVIMRALPASLASTLPSTVLDVDYTITTKPRPPLPEDAGASPGYDVIISGSLQLKTESDSTFDSGDSTNVAAGAIASTVRTALTAIKSDAETRAGMTFTQLDEPEVGTGGTRGEISFAITGVAMLPNGVLGWDESVVLARITQDKIVGGTQGKQVFKHPNGPLWTCAHDLVITSLEMPSYKPLPFIDEQRWHEDVWRPSKPQPSITANGTRIFAVAWHGEWTRVAEDIGSEGQYDYNVLAGAV